MKTLPARYLFIWPLLTLPLLINNSATFLNFGIFLSNLFLLNILLLGYKRKIKFNFFSFFAIALLIGYGLGSLTSIATAPDIVANHKSTWKYSFALWLVISTCYTLIIFSKTYSSIDFLSYKSARKTHSSVEINFYLLIIVFTLIKYNKFGFGVNNEDSESIAVIPLIINYLLIVLPALLFNDLLLKNTNTRLIQICLITSLVLIMPLGRRTIIYALILSLVWSSHAMSTIKFNRIKFTIVSIATITLIVISNYLFLAIRVSSTIDRIQYISAKDKIIAAGQLLNTSGIDRINDYLVDQNSDRAFVLRFLSDLVAAEYDKTPMLGMETYESLKIIVPSFMGIQKFGGDIENLAQFHFHLPLSDEANSILTTAISDFGLLGIYILPLIMAFIYQIAFILICSARKLPTLSKKISVLIIIFSALNCENTIAGYVGVIRDSVLMLGITSVIVFILRMINLAIRPKRYYF